nr:hypothetical protein [Bacteroidota bacterium]
MSYLIFVCTIALYIISLAASLFMLLLNKNININKLKKIIVAHCALGIVAIVVFLFFKNGKTTSISQTINILFICSGVALCGIALKSKLHFIIRMYFSIYALSFLLFATNTSALVGFIANFDFYSNAENKFNIRDNYFIELQTSMLTNESLQPRYKMYQRIFYFNKTIVRDIDFEGKLDSVIFIGMANDSLRVAGYSQNKIVEKMIPTKPVSSKTTIEQKRN